MRLEPGYLFGMVLQTIPEPRKVARDLFNLNTPRQTQWMLLALFMTLSAAVGIVYAAVLGVGNPTATGLLSSPMAVAIAEAVVAVATVYVVHWLARMFGGEGRFEDALMTIVWLNFVLLLVQTGVFLLTLISAGMAMLLWMGGGVMGFWIMSYFISEAYGFESALKVFGVILMASFVAVVGLSVLITIYGALTGQVAPTGGINGL